MKIKKIITICGLLACTKNLFPTFNYNTFDQEFDARMQAIEEQFNTINKNMRSMHDRLLKNSDNQTKNFSLIEDLQNNGKIKSYQQSSTSLSFANKEKTIKIEEKKDNAGIMYTILITDKHTNKEQEDKEQSQDDITQLKDLQNYTKKNFNSPTANKILQQCVHAISEKNKDDIINMQVSKDSNQTKYFIEIAHKKEMAEQNELPTNKTRKIKDKN